MILARGRFVGVEKNKTIQKKQKMEYDKKNGETRLRSLAGRAPNF